MRKLIHYSAAQEAPWLWYETSDPSKVPDTGSHGTGLFKTHPDLPGIIVQWFATTLIKTPGHATVDPLAAAAILNQLAVAGGAAQVTQQLMEARKHDPKAQLFPEVSLDIIGSGFLFQAETDEKAGHLREAEMEMKVGHRDIQAQSARVSGFGRRALQSGGCVLTRGRESACAPIRREGVGHDRFSHSAVVVVVRHRAA